LCCFCGVNHDVILARPGAARPIVGGQLVRWAFNAAGTSTIGLLTGWRRLLNGHVGITKAYHPRLTIGTGADYALLSAAYIASGAVTWQIAWVHRNNGLKSQGKGVLGLVGFFLPLPNEVGNAHQTTNDANKAVNLAQSERSCGGYGRR